MMEYNAPLRGAAARFTAIKKKYPKFTTFKAIISKNGTISAVSISACPEDAVTSDE